MADSEALRAVRSLVVTRAIVTTLVAGLVATATVWSPLPFAVGPFAAVAAASYLLSLGGALLAPRVERPEVLAEALIYADILLETALVYVTGGPYSAFPFLYLLSILAMSIVVAPRRSFAAATACVLLHGVLLTLVFYRVLPPVGRFATGRDLAVDGILTILAISGNVGACYTVAYFATYLAERLRQARGQALRTEASLADLQVLHEDIVQSVASGLLTFDRDGRVTAANRTAEALCRQDARHLRGASWETVFAEAPPVSEIWTTLLRRDRTPFRFEARLCRGDATDIPVGVSASFLRREFGLICSFQDLTGIKRMEAQVRHADRLAALGRFAAGLAHEIRNPLGSIRGSIEVLRESLKPQGDDRRLMDIVLRESDRLDRFIAEFLDFSRPHAAARADTDLVGLVEEILLLLGNQATPGVRVVRRFAEPTVKARVDAGQIRQALWNLCRNALEAMPDGGELRVGVRAAGERGARVAEIAVEDTGVGIPADQRARLFEPFYTTKAHGTGLGLAIVHRVVEEHEGEVRVESAPGTGSRFALRLPLEDE